MPRQAGRRLSCQTLGVIVRRLALFVALLLGCASVTAAPVPAGAVEAVTAYSSALNSGDCKQMLELMSPLERSRIGTLLCSIVSDFVEQGVRERLRKPTASLSSGRYRMIVFPNSRSAFPDRQPTLTDGTYVVHSSDAGRTWHVLDLGCVDSRWVKAVYPPYRGFPVIEQGTTHRLSSSINDI